MRISLDGRSYERRPRFARARALALAAGLLIGASAAVSTLKAAGPAMSWPMFGGNLQNTATNGSKGISTGNVAKLKPKWIRSVNGDVSARAAVVDGVVYFPDWGTPVAPGAPVTTESTLWALDANSGAVVWSHAFSDYLPGLPVPVHSRTTPAVVDGVLYIGTQEGAFLLAIDAATGSLIWKKQLESPANDMYAIISTSPAVANGVVYTGVASLAEGATLYGVTLSASAARGSVVAVSAATGDVLWKTFMVPPGYNGGGVWGSNPVVDIGRNTVFVGTGNNYRHPDSTAASSTPGVTYGDCIANGGTAASCNAPNNYVDAVVALDATTGAIKWANSLTTWSQYGVTDGSDDWNVDCLVFPTAPFTQCPTAAGPDYDFGSAPNLITYSVGVDEPKTILGAGQKSGIYYALDPDTGARIWHTQVGPGSALGGMEWGSASDGTRIYVQIANLYGIAHGGGSAGSFSALDPATGAILWQTPDPSGAIDTGPVTVANGVVYAGSMAGFHESNPTMLAMDARDGTVLWSFAAGASVSSGATVIDKMVYWGSGYGHLGFPGQTAGTKFYAFSLSGK